uniref:Uncharacterized protein n=1 Tax=Sphaerodactylus townsendi TaxID=933632 RepID=A0ACB8FZQ7_9SAUR
MCSKYADSTTIVYIYMYILLWSILREKQIFFVPRKKCSLPNPLMFMWQKRAMCKAEVDYRQMCTELLSLKSAERKHGFERIFDEKNSGRNWVARFHQTNEDLLLSRAGKTLVERYVFIPRSQVGVLRKCYQLNLLMVTAQNGVMHIFPS